MAPRHLTATEIADYCYCRRAWWLNRQGVSPTARRHLKRGSEWHESHVRKALRTRLLQLLGYVFLLAGVVTAAVMGVMLLLLGQ